MKSFLRSTMFKALIIFTFSLYLHADFSNYLDNNELDKEISGMKHRFLNKQVLARTSAGNKIHLLTLSDSEDEKPAVLIVGDTVSNSPVGCEITVKWLKSLIKDDEKLVQILKNNTLYIIPRPAPDALKHTFGIVSRISSNSRSFDETSDVRKTAAARPGRRQL